MLESGEWKDLNFKSYNFEALGKAPEGGSLHPLLKVREQFRSLFLEMGFEEMPTNNYVESSFWNFDALFQPQQHPARDAHDTFFLSAPELSKIENQDYWNRVQKTHEEGMRCPPFSFVALGLLGAQTLLFAVTLSRWLRVYRISLQVERAGGEEERPTNTYYRSIIADAAELGKYGSV